MKRRYRMLGFIAGLTVTALFALYVARSLHGRNLSIYATPRAFTGIALAAFLYCIGTPFIALAWRSLLRGLHVFKSWRELTAILCITQIVKYVPGNIGQYIGRATMSISRGIPARALAVTVILEMLLVVTAALTVGAGTGVLSISGIAFLHSEGWKLAIVVCLVLVAIAGLASFGKLAPILLRHYAPQHAHFLEGSLLPNKLRIAQAFMLYCAGVLCTGFGFVVLAHLLLPEALHDNWLLLACYALAWIIGFVTPGAPAGLGVREGLLLLMLGPVYTPALAGLLVIAMRLATTLGDVSCFISGLLILPSRGTEPSPHMPRA